MNSNQSNNSDGSFHIRVNPKVKPKPIPKVEIKEVLKHDKKQNRK